MAAIDADDLSRRMAGVVLGQDLDRFSIAELDQRIVLLRHEIARTEAAKEKKRSLKSAADDFFKSL
ncbi:MAG: DUF1192 domain-containing protein [Beijerinckiaceae bacterium]|nr:DUF1192 domain-containing protein [Beijerinckiaceae bacterium]